MKIKYVLPIMSLIVIAVAITAVIILQPKNNATSSNQKLKIVAAENFWGNIISQIGGDRVEVTSIISDPSTDPHLYESDAHDALALSNANLVIKNGLGYDNFIDKLLAASPNNQRQVLSVEKILNIGGDNPNPHVWYNVAMVPAVADAIEQAMAAKDPSNSGLYATNLSTFKKSLQPIMDTINQIKSKYSKTPVAYTERVAGYLLASSELDVKTPAGFASSIEDGNDPNPSDTAIMNSLMTDHSVRVLLYNAQATSAVTQHVRDLAGQAGIPVVGVTETLPSDQKTYQSWQLNQAKALLAALGG
ncbi:MAG TPA: zinc ABC transporter substrate-binding protein [Patescibacteria group bacterium]|nr:zinc ABC transporter substrate-binding protein [Patescibacteria group bacterium]